MSTAHLEQTTTSAVVVAIADRPAVEPLKASDALGGVRAEFPTVSPIYRAFGRMIGDGAYDASEIAITAFLQARAAGRHLLLLPVVVAGGFHHRSLVTTRESSLTDPRELVGRRVGVRSVSQTTGLWVRGWLREQFGVGTGDVTWVTTEGSHVREFTDPDNVVRTDRTIEDELQLGTIDAAVLSRPSEPWIRPLLPDPLSVQRAWFEQHRVVPINHMVAVTERFAQDRPDALAELQRLLVQGVDAAVAAARTENPGRPPSAAHGMEQVLPGVELAARYAVEQRLIPAVPDLPSLFAPVS